MNKNKFVNDTFRDLTTLGGFTFYCLILLDALIFQELTLLFHLLFGLIFTFIVIVIIRTFYFKSRPNKENYHNFIGRIDASSFPSWHAARIVFLAFIFSYFFKSNAIDNFNNYLTLLFIIIALLVSYSRVYLKKHDWWDIIGGVILGIITFWLSNFI